MTFTQKIDLKNIFKDEGLTLYNQHKFSLDEYNPPEYQDSQEIIDSNCVFESNNKDVYRKLKVFNMDPDLNPSIFKYFLDGSRKIYLVAEAVSDDNKYRPIIAGQVAAACCKRNNKKINYHKLIRKNVIALYDRMPPGKLDRIRTKILEKAKNSRVEWEVVDYKVAGTGTHSSGIKSESDTVEDRGIGKIQQVMHKYEIDLVEDMVFSGELRDDAMLIIDGSLQFVRQKFDKKIFENVISVAKSFDPHKTNLLKQKNKEVGIFLLDLEYGSRTPVFRFSSPLSSHVYGIWYIRIRNRKSIKNPLDGILKVEKMAVTDEEVRFGFDSGLIDDISSYLFSERIPTCYGCDNRWTSHLYPIYATEKFLKSSFISDTYFINLFQ